MFWEECYLNAEEDISKNKTCDKIRMDVNDLLWNGFNYSQMIKLHSENYLLLHKID